MESAADLLQGAVDCHVHTSPDVVPRKYDDLELAREAGSAGLRAAVIKSHTGDTAARAALASAHTSGTRIYGGVVLNESVGGLNPRAVEISLQLGGKIVWMPTVDAAHHRFRTGKEGGISILDARGELRSEIRDILRLVREYEATLSTGHLSLEEIHRLAAAARQGKVAPLVVAHPELWITFLSLEAQRDLLEKEVLFERCFYAGTLPPEERTELAQTVSWVASLGAKSTILASDLGQAHNIAPVEGLEAMIARFLEAGKTAADIRCMLHENPSRVLRLS